MSRTSDPLIPAFTTAPPGDDLAVVRVDDEGAADDSAIPTGELEAVRAPTQVRSHHDDLAVMDEVGALCVTAR